MNTVAMIVKNGWKITCTLITSMMISRVMMIATPVWNQTFLVMRRFPFSFDLKLITVYHKFYFSLKHTQKKTTRHARAHECARRRMVSSEYPDRPECPKQDDCQYPGEALRKQDKLFNDYPLIGRIAMRGFYLWI